MKKYDLKKLVKEEFESILKELGENPNQTDIVDGEDSITKSQLMDIAAMAKGSAEALAANDQEVDSWVQSHISAALELITHVSDYMGYNGEQEDDGIDIDPESAPEEPKQPNEKMNEALTPEQKAAAAAKVSQKKSQLSKATDPVDKKVLSADIDALTKKSSDPNAMTVSEKKSLKVKKDQAYKLKQYMEEAYKNGDVEEVKLALAIVTGKQIGRAHV